MIKYAKVVNEETKECQVGLGTNAEFYMAQGMTEQNVEKCERNGSWYLAGHVPQETPEEIKEREIQSIKRQLDEIDNKSFRAVRAILTKSETEEDRVFLTKLENQAELLRQQIKDLQGE